MSDETRRKPAVSLERPGRLRPSWPRRLARLAVVIGLCAVIISWGSDATRVDRHLECATAVDRVAARVLPATIAVQSCELAFLRRSDPAIGVLLANALNTNHDVAAAKGLALAMLTTPAKADALYVLAKIALADDSEDAASKLKEAIKLHEAAPGAATNLHDVHGVEHNARALARDAGLLAGILTDQSEFAEALRLLDQCSMAAERGHDTYDTYLQYYCHTVAARTLIQVGYFSAAKLEIEIAAVFEIAAAALGAAGDEARADVLYQRGNLAQESAYQRGNLAQGSAEHHTAIRWFKDVLEASQGSPYLSRTIDTELNLAYSLAETGEFDEAWRYLEEARLIDSDHKKAPEWTWAAAQLAYRQHDPKRASELIAKYFQLRAPSGSHASDLADDPVDRDDRIDVATLQARIELERNDLGQAEQWAQRAVKEAERVRSAQTTLELRPWVLAKRRAPYEVLFTALARSGRVEDAAMAFDEWQGRTVQDVLATPRPPASLDRHAIREQIIRLGPWLRQASQATFARSPDRDAVLSTMRGIDLLALIVANDEVWRLTAHHGPPRLSRLGTLTTIQKLVDKFRSHPSRPTDVEGASELSALLLSDDELQVTREVLYVLIDGQLAGLPVAALRRDGVTLIERRPITRVLRLPETVCVHASRSGHATVLADPDGSLPLALTEGNEVARLLHTTSVSGAAATRAALRAAEHDAVLHVAAHTAIGFDGAAIRVADGEVSALEIATRRGAPSLAVLSGCSTATSGEPASDASPPDTVEIASSLAAGFLAAGSLHVVATLRPVHDDGPLAVITRFYRAGGVADPARALAAAQSALVHTDNLDWPYFTVFGLDVCSEDNRLIISRSSPFVH